MPTDYARHQFRSTLLQSVVEEALTFFYQTPLQPLPPAESFQGVGVYALYLVNATTLYGVIGEPTRQQPIYVGKAVPAGWRAAREHSTPPSTALYRRLREHTRSLEQAQNLALGDFKCRFVLLDGLEVDLIAPIEAALIRHHKPIWNTQIDGFGNHDPGKGRYNQAPSEWDQLHPGRPWVQRLRGQPATLASIRQKLQSYTDNLT